MRLIITEKPSVAVAICAALGLNEEKKHDGYIEAGGTIATWCLGHLIEMSDPEAYGAEYKKWSYEQLPIIPKEYRYQVKRETKRQFEIIKKLLNRDDVKEVISAGDAGREGELLIRLVFLMAGYRKPFKRLWISSMEEAAIKHGMENLQPGDRYDNLYQAALCRQKADWLVGMNGTRLFSCIYHGKVKKVGRVQSPTLAMIVDRDAQIAGFRKLPYYTVELSDGYIRMRTERMGTKEAAQGIADRCKGQPVTVKGYVTKEIKTGPPKLYDLTALQREANTMFSFTAKQTLSYLQSLYEKKLVTYPRTDSRYLTLDMESTAANMASLIRSMTHMGDEDPDIKRILNDKEVSDHHALIPTVQIARAKMDEIPDSERKILELIMLRVAEATSKPCIVERISVDFECAGLIFSAVFEETKKKGFRQYTEIFRKRYSKTAKDLKEDGIDEEIQETAFDITKNLPGSQMQGSFEVAIKEGTTKPSPHFTEAALLKAMEKAGVAETDKDAERKGLGTPATRADIIEKLVRDGYVQRTGKTLTATDEGIRLITILPDRIKSPSYTAEWENRLSLIAKGEASSEEFMDMIETEVRQMVEQYHSIKEEDR